MHSERLLVLCSDLYAIHLKHRRSGTLLIMERTVLPATHTYIYYAAAARVSLHFSQY